MTQIIHGNTPEEPQGPNGPKYKLVRSTDLDRTEKQINLLVSVLEEARIMSHHFLDSGETYEVDPRVKEAAAKTYEAAALQLRNLIDEQPRWSQNDPEVEGFIEKLAESNAEVAEAQKRLLAQRTRPCFLLGATLHRIQYENQPAWLACVGKEPSPGGIAGIGNSPAAALDAFDHVFYRAEAEAKTADPEPTQASPEPEQKPKRRTKKKV